MNALQVFSYEGQDVRTIQINGARGGFCEMFVTYLEFRIVEM